MINRNFLCVNIHVAEKAVWKKPFGTNRDSDCVHKSYV
jgi:hypothetical protein